MHIAAFFFFCNVIFIIKYKFMKQYTPLYVSYEELYKAYLDCRKRKRSTANAILFEMDENVNLFKLWNELNSMLYAIGRSIAFLC